MRQGGHPFLPLSVRVAAIAAYRDQKAKKAPWSRLNRDQGAPFQPEKIISSLHGHDKYVHSNPFEQYTFHWLLYSDRQSWSDL